MERVRRNERIAALTKILTASPNQVFTLSLFCDLFAAAKSTMSEDIDILREVLKAYGLGKLETVTGAAGGVRFRPAMNRPDAYTFVQSLCAELKSPGRQLAGGFLYMSDILSNPQLVRQMAIILVESFYEVAPDFVLTMETKGIPVALMAAEALGVPLVIARRASKVYEGSAVNINYVTGSSDIQTMSLDRRAVKSGQRALIVDDFLRAGGTAKGMADLMAEFGVQVVGQAFVMATAKPENKLISGELPLMVLDQGPEGLTVRPADWLKGDNGR